MKRIGLFAVAALAAHVVLAGVVREGSLVLSADPLRPAAGERLTVPGFDGTSYSVVLGERHVSRSGIVTFSARTADSAVANVSVTATRTGSVARRTDPRTGRVLSTSVNGREVRLRETTKAKGGRCGADRKPARVDGRKRASVRLTGDPLVDGAAYLRRGEMVTNVIDVLIAVDASAADWIRTKSDFAGQDEAVRAFAADAIERCNATYANTGLDAFFTFNLADAVEIAADCSKVRDAEGYVDSEKLLFDMFGRKGDLKSDWVRILDRREEVCADIVSLLVSCGEDEPEGTVGIGMRLDDDSIVDTAYAASSGNVCLIESVATTETLAHEIGHNMGAGHAEMADKDGSGPQLYGYSTGYYFNVTNAAGQVFMHAATVMAYDSDGREEDLDLGERWGEAPEYADDATRWNLGLFTETAFFSSSVHTYRYVSDGEIVDTGIPLGDELHDNTRLLSKTYPIVANYRPRNPTPELVQKGETFVLDGGRTIEPIELTVQSVSDARLVLSGLPAGLKFDSKTWRITGTPTKVGSYTVKASLTNVTVTRAVEQTFTIVVRDFDLAVRATEGGTVKGAGRYLAGKKASLSAKASAGNVFAGWYADASLETPLAGGTDYRTASLPLVMTNRDVTVWARFEPVEKDAASLTLLLQDAYTAAKDGSFDLVVPVASLSLPKLSVKGLPAGLKFDAKGNRITGVAKKPGVYTVTVSATNLSVKKAVSAAFSLTVPNVESALLPGLRYETDAYPVSAGVALPEALIDLTALEGYTVTAMSGLPAGLKFNAKTGVLSGVPTKAGSFTVTITAKNGRQTVTATVTVSVEALPAWASGTFEGCAWVDDAVGGQVSLTVSANGKMSGKLLRDGQTWTLAAASFSSVDRGEMPEESLYYAALVGKCGKQAFTNDVTVGAQAVEPVQGVRGGLAEFTVDLPDSLSVQAWQNRWKLEPFKTMAKDFASRTLDLGNGVVLKTTAAGGVTAAGAFVVGKDARDRDIVHKATCSTVLIPLSDGLYRAFLYFPPKPGKFDGASFVVTLAWDGEAKAWSGEVNGTL